MALISEFEACWKRSGLKPAEKCVARKFWNLAVDHCRNIVRQHSEHIDNEIRMLDNYGWTPWDKNSNHGGHEI